MKSFIKKHFGEYVLDDATIKKYMSYKSYKNYLAIKLKGESLDKTTAKAIATAIKKWAMKKGVTHYSHWFMPLTNKTAEKQVSFIEIDSKGNFIEEFSEKALIKGETDASSFPNGGNRMTFEARGYTVWDYTSPVFIKEDDNHNKVVYIPTAFCSYNGTALDEKTPLLRALESLNTQSIRVLKLLGYTNIKKVNLNLGAEQEYFLIDSDKYDKRLDLKLTGRTLLGAKPIKSQEMCSHYFGMIEDRVSAFMNHLDKDLWTMGITAKLQHNEVAPCQHEFVPIYGTSNIACDQNQLIMQTITHLAPKYGFRALFHEKPFSYINGSGKHANWSLDTDTGMGLFNIKLKDKRVFYTFFTAMIEAIDRYYKLIRLSTAYRSNDLRLGGDEAPPSLVSVFTSDYVLDMLSTLKTNSWSNSKNLLETGVKSLPKMERDFCDRNRTSPFAFTGNKFEFRMVGSSQSVAWPTTCIATMLSKILKEYADMFEKSTCLDKELLSILNDKFKKHSRIIFNGNGYDNTWREEAKKRGLVEYKDSLATYSIIDDSDIIELFSDTKVLNSDELALRRDTLIKNYVDTVIIEAKTLKEMLNKRIYPCLNAFLIDIAKVKTAANLSKTKIVAETINTMSTLHTKLDKLLVDIETTLPLDKKSDISKKLLSTINDIRTSYDHIEPILADKHLPYPTYNDILL